MAQPLYHHRHRGTANRTARQTAQNRHREWLHRPERSALRARARRELRGLRLGCWCEQPGPCHGHNLCEVADADIDDDADGTAPSSHSHSMLSMLIDMHMLLAPFVLTQ